MLLTSATSLRVAKKYNKINMLHQGGKWRESHPVAALAKKHASSSLAKHVMPENRAGMQFRYQGRS
jgi:hypothetical protein